jgi:DNA-directed RNA polymerase subunit RPC12/RpoP
MKIEFNRFISDNMTRWFNRLYAFINGYFWLPCSLCGKNFGGHEWFPDNSISISYGEGEAVCPNCGEKAREINKENNWFIPKSRDMS